MKYFLNLTILLFSLTAAAAPSELLRCLGSEEQALHKAKSLGPDYQLNQQLISELIQVQNVDLAPEYLTKVCPLKITNPSRRLLALLLDKGPSVFSYKTQMTSLEKSIATSMLEDFMQSVQQSFLSYIASVQQEAPTADCLKKNIPELDLLFVDIKYLEEDVETKYLFKDKGLAEKIMTKLLNYPVMLKSCIPKKPQKKAKKTDKSGSTPDLKKP